MRYLFAILTALALAACGAESDNTPGPDAGASSGDIAFMESCSPAADQCADGLVCFSYNMKGPHCTHACAEDTDCEAPSPGCNGMGVCKAP